MKRIRIPSSDSDQVVKVWVIISGWDQDTCRREFQQDFLIGWMDPMNKKREVIMIQDFSLGHRVECGCQQMRLGGLHAVAGVTG